MNASTINFILFGREQSSIALLEKSFQRISKIQNEA